MLSNIVTVYACADPLGVLKCNTHFTHLECLPESRCIFFPKTYSQDVSPVLIAMKLNFYLSLVRWTFWFWFCWVYYRRQTSLGQGNVFTPVSHSVHGGVMMSHPVMNSTPPPDSTITLVQHPPPWTALPLPRTAPPLHRQHHPQDSTLPPPWTAPPPVNKWAVLSYWNAFLFCNGKFSVN